MEQVDFCKALSLRLGQRVTAEDVYFCFRLILGRDPNPEEIPGHMQAIGQDLPHVVRQYLNSQEFAARNLLNVPDSGYALAEMEGYQLYVDPEDDAVGRHAMTGTYEAHVTAVFRDHLTAGATVVDIGANMGVFTALSAHLVGPGGRVISIEPNPRNCRFLEATRRRNGWTWQTTHCVAASDQAGMLALFSAYSNGSVTEPSEELAAIMRSTMVQAVALDQILQLDRLDFVKIDVEGHEHEALTGFEAHLRRFRPRIVSEFTPGSMLDPGAYLEFLYRLGYELAVIAGDGPPVSCGQDREAIMSAWRRSGVDHIDLFATPLP